jgi:hypothetical protein
MDRLHAARPIRNSFAAAILVLLCCPTAGLCGGLDSGLSQADLEAFWLALYPSGPQQKAAAAGATGYDVVMLATADPDECFIGVGEDNLYPFDFSMEACTNGVPKINESYVFGLARAGRQLWFGTAPNMGCLVYGTIADQGFPLGLPAFGTNEWVCEYGDGLFGQARDLPPSSGDWRPPSVYVYDTVSGTKTNVAFDDPLREDTLGLRAAGYASNVVFMAGPTITGVGGPDASPGVNMFAFRRDTREFLGSQEYPQFSNIRKMIRVRGKLYTGVLLAPPEPGSGGADSAPRGAILRWAGSVDDPFQWEMVGLVDGDPVELALHRGRIFVSTWPDFSRVFDESYDYAGLWMSPLLGADGLNFEDRDGWYKVWSVKDYEPDEVSARMYNGGALASFGGYLYWGTTHAPLSAGFAHTQFYDLLRPGNPDLVADVLRALLGSHRPVSIFRGRFFGSAFQQTEVLYGLATMPTFIVTPALEDEGFWLILPNKMGPPMFGPAGFGNFYNTYTWTMARSGGELFVGTMDWSYMLAKVMLPVIFADVIDPFPDIELPGADYGGDLMVFPSASEPAQILFSNGIGNYGSYGTRTMEGTPGTLYLGMANAMNLLLNPPQSGLPSGGWELLQLQRSDP